VPGKRVQIDEKTWHVLEVLRREKMATFQEARTKPFLIS
jgi:hypothetical protein